MFRPENMIVLADDLTGTLDTAVQFSEYGIFAMAFPTMKSFFENETDADVYVINTSTRHLQAQEAYQSIFSLAKYIYEHGGCRVLKKTDSALRGNIGIELTAVLNAFHEKVLHFIPAYPDMNRYTRGEIHYCDGVPVAESVFGKDPFEPVKYSSVRKIIQETSNINVKFVSDIFLQQIEDKPTICIYEAKSNQEMQEICKSALKTKETILLAGCAGLALALARALKKGKRLDPKLPETDKVLLVSGSLNSKSLQQIDYLIRKGYSIQYLDWDSQLKKPYLGLQSCTNFIENICKELQTKHVSILATSGGLKHKEMKDISRPEVGEAISYIIGNILLKTTGCVLAVFGGDTLYDIISHVAKGGIVPVKEVMPGVPVSIVVFPNGNQYVIVSRSGGFGTEDSMEKIIELFRK